MHIGRQIKMARIACNLTQEQLAEKIHKTRPLISHIEQTGKVNPFTLQKIVEVLGIDPEELAQADEPPIKWFPASVRIKELEERIQHLLNENETLRQLVKSHEEVITLLKEKNADK